MLVGPVSAGPPVPTGADANVGGGSAAGAPGSTLVIPPGTILNIDGPVAEHVRCEGTLTATPGSGAGLLDGVEVVGPGRVDLNADGWVYVNDAVSGVHGTGAEMHLGTLAAGHSGAGVFTQSDGVVTVAGYTVVGYAATSTGTYVLDGGSLRARTYLVMGQDGAGVFVQNGGEVVADLFYLGVSGGSQGAHQMHAGTLRAETGYVSYYGPGTFRQTGGDVTFTGDLHIGTPAGADGSYEISGGSLTVGPTVVGRSGAGHFMQTGGASSAGDLQVGASDGTGEFEIVGGRGRVTANGYTQGPGGTLISRLDATGISEIDLRRGATLDGVWTVIDEGAPFARWDVLTAPDGITGDFDVVNLPGPDWRWGATADALWLEHVPEPAALALLGVGAIGLIRRRRRGAAADDIHTLKREGSEDGLAGTSPGGTSLGSRAHGSGSLQ